MQRQTLENPKKYLLSVNLPTQAIYTNIPTRHIFKKVSDNRRVFLLRAGQHSLPRTLVLHCRLHSDAQFISSP